MHRNEQKREGTRWGIAATLVCSSWLSLACGATSVDAEPNCYSPTKNLAHAYEADAKGCACDADKEADVCVGGVALMCEHGAWQAVEDGPCLPAPRPLDVACGARAGASCSASEYCAYEAGQLCGAADAQAVCKPRPEGCIELYAPVCGCDQKTYDNSCLANAAGSGILTAGACETSSGGDSDCYSPTQNTAQAYEAGAQGCACDATKDESVCIQGVALVCDESTWQAVLDGPCFVP